MSGSASSWLAAGSAPDAPGPERSQDGLANVEHLFRTGVNRRLNSLASSRDNARENIDEMETRMCSMQRQLTALQRSHFNEMETRMRSIERGMTELEQQQGGTVIDVGNDGGNRKGGDGTGGGGKGGDGKGGHGEAVGGKGGGGKAARVAPAPKAAKARRLGDKGGKGGVGKGDIVDGKGEVIARVAEADLEEHLHQARLARRRELYAERASSR